MRSRWAAIGAAVAVSLGAGGLAIAGAVASAPSSVVTITPCRLMDTRAGRAIGPRSSALESGVPYVFSVRGTNGRCTVPPEATGVVLTVSVVPPSGGNGYISIYPSDAGPTISSNTNWNAFQSVVATEVTVALSANGSLAARVQGSSANLIVDVSAYLLPAGSTTTTTTTTPANAMPAELVSREPTGEAPLGFAGSFLGASSNGRYVLFARPDACGPLLRDRTAGVTRVLYTADASGICPVVSSGPRQQLSTSANRVMVNSLPPAACSAAGFSFQGAGFNPFPEVLDVATGSRFQPFDCTDKAYFGGSPIGPESYQVSYPGFDPAFQGFFAPPAGITAANPLDTFGAIRDWVLTGDGSSVVFTHYWRTKTWSFPVGAQPRLVSVRDVVTLERVNVATRARSVLTTLFDKTNSSPVTDSFSGGTQLVASRLPVTALAGTDFSGTVSILTASDPLDLSDTNQAPDSYAVSALGKSLLPGGTAGSVAGSLSQNGRFVVFGSSSPSIVTGDTNGLRDVFLFDRNSGTSTRVSVGSLGAQSNRPAYESGTAVSDDGRFVSFISDASTLGCAGNVPTYFIRDRTASRTYAPLRRPNGQPVSAGPSQTVYGYSFYVTETGGVSGDGSTFIGSTSDWAGTSASDIGIEKNRVWSRSAGAPAADC
jgi:hypothetical protein